ncbi:MAG TPA: hypothetical protein VG499_05620, partial [Actinomycetota bacterium]|nr:hypothetical protein [Actinomycetota bacterium]
SRQDSDEIAAWAQECHDREGLGLLAVERRLGMELDHEAEIEDMGQVFQAVVYSITAERWRDARQR